MGFLGPWFWSSTAGITLYLVWWAGLVPHILALPWLFCQVSLIIWLSIPLCLRSFDVSSQVSIFLFFLYRCIYWGLLKLQLLRYVKHHLFIWKLHISLIKFTQYNVLNFYIKLFIKLRKISTSGIYRKEENEKKKEFNVNCQLLGFCNCHNFSSQQYWDSCSAKTRCSVKL